MIHSLLQVYIFLYYIIFIGESYDRNLVSLSLPLLPPLHEFRFSSIKLQNEDFIDTLELIKHVDVLSFYSIFIY